MCIPAEFDVPATNVECKGYFRFLGKGSQDRGSRHPLSPSLESGPSVVQEGRDMFYRSM